MNFYRLKVDDGRSAHYAFARPYETPWLEQVHCEMCGKIWKRDHMDLANNHLAFSIIFTNENFADFTICSYVDLISQKAKELMELADFKSYSVMQLTVIPKDEIPEEKLNQMNAGTLKAKSISNQKPDYYRMLVEIGAQLHEDSMIEWRDGCSFCEQGRGYKKIHNNYKIPNYLKLDTWQGDDLFRAKEAGIEVFCTDRFKDFYSDNGLTGLSFVPVEAR